MLHHHPTKFNISTRTRRRATSSAACLASSHIHYTSLKVSPSSSCHAVSQHARVYTHLHLCLYPRPRRAVAHVHTMAPMPIEAHYQTTCLLAYSCSPWYCHPIRPRCARHIALVHAPSSPTRPHVARSRSRLPSPPRSPPPIALLHRFSICHVPTTILTGRRVAPATSSCHAAVSRRVNLRWERVRARWCR